MSYATKKIHAATCEDQQSVTASFCQVFISTCLGIQIMCYYMYFSDIWKGGASSQKHFLLLTLILVNYIYVHAYLTINFTTGCGTLFKNKNFSVKTIRDLVKDGVIIELRGKYYSNTSYLGAVLMETMLQEVSEFCKVDIQQNWATQAHQQVQYSKIYYVLNPEKSFPKKLNICLGYI